MKTGRTLPELAAELQRQATTKRDYLADTRKVGVNTDLSMSIGHDLSVGINPTAHGQIAEHTKIPKAYYDRMLTEEPGLLANNINTWFQKYPAERLVRTLDGRARAFMSSSYRPLDNVDLAEAALPALLDMGVEVMSCEITEARMYIKVVDKRIMRDLPDGWSHGNRGHARFDTASPALVLSNSEVGMGALAVNTSVWTGGCSNMMVISERSSRKYHIGARAELGDEVYRMLSDETRKISDQALWAQIGDVVRGAFDRAQFDATCDKIAATADNLIVGDPVRVVELTAKKFGMTDTERGSVLQHLIRFGSLTQYGLHAAVTRAAEDLEDYDRASEFERLGGRIVELPKQEWLQLAEAA